MKLLHVTIRGILRQPARTMLTLMGVAVSIFVFSSLLSLDRGVRRMVETTGSDLVLTVFERFKACPPYSRMPVHYADSIASIPGVREVMPVRFMLSNCQTTTDLVAVHGIDTQKLRDFRVLDLPDAEYEAFQDERGSAIVGRSMAEKYGWRVGDQVTLKELRGISFVIRGVFRAPGSALESVILVDREYLELSIEQVGIVTMFLVLLDDPLHVDSVSETIDATFANAQTQTKTGPERSFIANAIADFSAMVRFAQVVAYLALILLLVSVANSVSMSVRDRLREMAILKTLGYRRSQVAGMIIFEAVVLAVLASLLGSGVAALVMNSGALSISVEGYTISPHMSAAMLSLSLLVGAFMGLFGAYLPARRGAQLPIVAALREVD